MALGYKIMILLPDGFLHSMADRRITVPLLPLQSWYHPQGIWLGSSVEYIQQYYGSYDDDPMEMDSGEFEIRCTFKYEQKHIVKGTSSLQGTSDSGVEFAVERLQLLHAYNVTNQQIIF